MHGNASHALRLAGHRDDEVTRSALQALAAWGPVGARGPAELAAALVDVTTTATWRSAAATVLTPTVWTVQPDLLPDVVAALVRGDAGPDAERLRDRPARQRVLHLVDGLCGQSAVARRPPVPVRRVADLLAADPTTLAAAARLRAALIWPRCHVRRRSPRPRRAGGRPVAGRGGSSGTARGAELGAGCGRCGGGRPGRGHVALTLTATAGAAAGWTDEWRARLRTLRTHPDPDVRTAALAVTTAPGSLRS